MNARTLGIVVVAAIIAIFSSSAAAEDADTPIGFQPKEAARLIARDADLDAVQKQVTALEAVVAAQAKQIAAQEKIIALQGQEIARQQRITALADEERDAYKARAERIVKDAGKDTLSLRVQARAGAGAIIGAGAAAIFPPAILIGPVIGGLVGLVEHWLVN